jgi:dTDP-glucose 4,6-dehydratase/UDP-glucose 4-epimerase
MRVKDARQTFLGIWIRHLIEKKPIQVFGDGQQLRDFNYVDDCVDAMLLAAANESANGKIYNLGSHEVVNLSTLAEMLINLGHDGKFELVPFPAERKVIDIGDYYSDYSLINKELGWAPRVVLLEGLTKTLNYYQENFRHYWDI